MAVNDELKRIGTNIRKIRELHGLTREEFCKALFYDVNYWGSIERGERAVNVQKLIEISQYFHVSVDELIGCSEKAKASREQLAAIQKRLENCTPTQLAAVEKFVEEIVPHIR